MASKKLGELLVESGLITTGQLEEAISASKNQKGVRLGSIIVKKGFARDIDIAQTLSFQLGIPFVDLSTAQIDPEAVKKVEEDIARKYLLLPLFQEGKTLNLAMADPLNLLAIDDIRFSTGLDVQPQAATEADVKTALARHYHLNEPIEELMGDLKKEKHVEVVRETGADRDLSEQVRKSSAPPIIKMVDSIIIHAVESSASDIHVEPQEKIVKLRLRVDGIMRETMQLPKWVQGPVVSRIKLMAMMDIAERRVAQDGRLKVRLGDSTYDLRVSTLPTQYGETVVMRVLDSHAKPVDLEKNGLSASDAARVLEMIKRPQGVVLVTGPTGSGKTSTLYAMISRIKTPAINIITIEDPIEYELKDVNQVAINDKTGLTFAYALRAVLRQDPDVILVGEMRDTETAVVAHQASMTGHMVFSTLHTNDAVSSITRLRNLGLPSHMIASALNGIIAQRLVRVICEHCKKGVTPTDEEIRVTGLSRTGAEKLYRGAGCPRCANTGYSGRTGIFEVLTATKKIKGLIADDAPESELAKAAAEAGMVPIQADGIKKVIAGVTTLDELTRVVYLPSEEDDTLFACTVCHESVTPQNSMCPHCGHFVQTRCLSCGKERHPDWRACPYCALSYGEDKKAIV